MGSPGGPTVTISTHFYRCKNFDTETRTCMAYDDRPEECFGFPWYDFTDVERSATPLPARCSFNVDVGRPVAVDKPTRRRGGPLLDAAMARPEFAFKDRS